MGVGRGIIQAGVATGVADWESQEGLAAAMAGRGSQARVTAKVARSVSVRRVFFMTEFLLKAGSSKIAASATEQGSGSSAACLDSLKLPVP